MTELESQIDTDKKDEMLEELKLLLYVFEPYKLTFDATPTNIASSILSETIVTIKLNESRTLLYCLDHHNNTDFVIKNDGTIFEDKELYENVRNTLQNDRTVIPKRKWDEHLKRAEQQIFSYLIKEKKLEDKDGFFREFGQFFNDLPEVPQKLLDCSRQLMDINFDDWDIDEGETNDPRLRALKEIQDEILSAYKVCEHKGKHYIKQRNQIGNIEINENTLGINRFTVLKMPEDNNSFYSAVAHQLESKDVKIRDIVHDYQSDGYFTHQELRELAINFIWKNSEEAFGIYTEDNLCGELPPNIHIIEYIKHHRNGETCADNRTIKALAQALGFTVKVYHQDNVSDSYNAGPHSDSKTLHLQKKFNHYSSLVARPLSDLLPFEIKYPRQSYKVKRIFELLNECERNEHSAKQLKYICGKLRLHQTSEDKVKRYFYARNIIKPKKPIAVVGIDLWYTDEDMNSHGRVLEKYGVNIDTQFSNRLTEDGIETLPSIQTLEENHPRYICYNVGGRSNRDQSGIHWVAVVLVKRNEMVTILYKDSKGDWNNSSEHVERLLAAYYKDKVEFIRHLQAEQKDDANCGPMTINNLEIMARIVQDANNKDKDGIDELVRLFKDESAGIAFTTQDQVERIRRRHSLQIYKKLVGDKDNAQQDASTDDLQTILTQLKLSDNCISMKDGKHFNLIKINEDGNSFYSAVSDQLRRIDIKAEISKENNQQNEYYTHKDIRALTAAYLEENRAKEFGTNIVNRLQCQNSLDLMQFDLTPGLYTIDEYIAHHSKAETFVDSDTITASAIALDITIKIYHTNGTCNDTFNANPIAKNIVYLQCNGMHYHSLVDVDADGAINKRKDELDLYIQKITEAYDQVKFWEIDQLDTWITEHKGQISKNFNASGAADKLCEAIAVIDKVNEIATEGQRLRDTQKIAILIFMQTTAMGHISQINTGEGKTTIVAVVAALKVMQGYKCHIITSNNVLAADGVIDKKIFYRLLDISVAENNPDETYTDGPKQCYSKDVVYGSITNFQFDWLRDSFEQQKTFGDINFDNVWVMLDEIDSLLIDQGSNIAKLSGPFPGMESLRYVYINIWVALAKVEDQVTQTLLKKLRKKAKKLLKSKADDDKEKQLKYETYENKLSESFLDDIKGQIQDQRDDLINREILPNHLHQYAEASVDRWIQHAISAKYQYNENVEYRIGEDRDGENIIIPVDNQNTGVSMKNTILSNGLHQFLQIKHNLCLTYESLTSCYVSNINYIKRYGCKLSGVTGTLGSKPERNLLASVFNLEFSVIPPHKPKQFIQLDGKICADDKFVNDVAAAALSQISRAVLIVCACIFDVKIIAKDIVRMASAARLAPNIVIYQDETDAHITSTTLDVGDIVIATNLAGRGTDFKTSYTLEKNGGLHVIEAFLPCNKRVEEQGFGRTSRQGNSGTGQIIIKTSELEELGIAVNNNSFDEIIRCRNELETMRLMDIEENKIMELEFKGLLFAKFSAEYATLKEKYEFGVDGIKWMYVLRDLKEMWAFWLDKQVYDVEHIREIQKRKHFIIFRNECSLSQAVEHEYIKFQEEAINITSGTISHNPFYSICLAERYLENSVGKSDREKAKSELENALKIGENSELLYSAYVKLFEIAIEDGGQVLMRYQKAVSNIFFVPLEKGCPDYKRHALYYLKRAEHSLAIEHDYLEKLIFGNKAENSQREPSILATIIANQTGATYSGLNSNHFAKNLQSRLLCLATYINNVKSLKEEVLRNVENADAGVIIDCKAPRYLNKLESQNKLKPYISEKSVDELEYIGMDSVYLVRKIHDVPKQVITGAQIQIGSGFSLLASAAAFPFLLPVNAPLGGALISEGITDIITSLIHQGQSGFDKRDYIKGKVISYGISILAMGINVMLSSSQILTKAMNASRSLATKLREIKGPFVGICMFLADKLDDAIIYFEKAFQFINAGKVAGRITLSASGQEIDRALSFNFAGVATHFGNRIKHIVGAEKIGLATLNNLMFELKSIVVTKTHEAVKSKISCLDEKGIFNGLSDAHIQQAISKLLDDGIDSIGNEIAQYVLKNFRNWKMQLKKNAVESLMKAINIVPHVNKICDEFISGLCGKSNDSNAIHIKSIINEISESISEFLCALVYSITHNTIVANPNVLHSRCQRIENHIDYGSSAANTSFDLVISAILELYNNKSVADASTPATSSMIECITKAFKENEIEIVVCPAEDAQTQFEEQMSDRGVVYLSGDQVADHLLAVNVAGNYFMVISDSGQIMSLDEYMEEGGFTKAEFIIPKRS